MVLRVRTWYDLRDFLQEQAERLEQLQKEIDHSLLEEAIEAHFVLQKQMAELCAEHGIVLEED